MIKHKTPYTFTEGAAIAITFQNRILEVVLSNLGGDNGHPNFFVKSFTPFRQISV
jgi:hypothetical protein